MREDKRNKIASILMHDPLSMQGDKFGFIDKSVLPHASTAAGVFGSVQSVFKRYPGLYAFIIGVLAPVRAAGRFRRLNKLLLARYGSEHLIVNYGSGPTVLRGRQDIINVDIFAFDAVDVLADTRLPFRDATVDLFLSTAVLEHMRDPATAAAEMSRCLKPNGELLVYVPFMQPVHAAPADYQRWTEAGLRELFNGLVILQSGVGAGPTSGFLWVLQHWIATLLSFGSATIKDVLLIILMLATFPLKHLDLLLEHVPRGGDLASGFFVHARKPAAGQSGAAED